MSHVTVGCCWTPTLTKVEEKGKLDSHASVRGPSEGRGKETDTDESRIWEGSSPSAFWFGFVVEFFFFFPSILFLLLQRGRGTWRPVGKETDLPSTCDHRCLPALPIPPHLSSQPGCHWSPTLEMLLEPSLQQNSPSCSFQTRRAWPCCRCHGHGVSRLP